MFVHKAYVVQVVNKRLAPDEVLDTSVEISVRRFVAAHDASDKRQYV